MTYWYDSEYGAAVRYADMVTENLRLYALGGDGAGMDITSGECGSKAMRAPYDGCPGGVTCAYWCWILYYAACAALG